MLYESNKVCENTLIYIIRLLNLHLILFTINNETVKGIFACNTTDRIDKACNKNNTLFSDVVLYVFYLEK